MLLSGVRFQGDPLLLLDLPPSLCLLLLTLQGLHALLAEEGPCLSSSLPFRFQHKWMVPLLYTKAEYGFSACSPIAWGDTLEGFVELFPEVFALTKGAPWGPLQAAKDTRSTENNPNQPNATLTVASVKAPQFRAVAARMLQLLAA